MTLYKNQLSSVDICDRSTLHTRSLKCRNCPPCVRLKRSVENASLSLQIPDVLTVKEIKTS